VPPIEPELGEMLTRAGVKEWLEIFPLGRPSTV
jgi:hypothetical protein